MADETKIKYSVDQQAVIDLRDKNLLVSAAAGSGKTAVLVERIIERITDPDHPVDVDRILVVTFTKAAAREMKERVMKALGERMDSLSKRLSLEETNGEAAAEFANLERQSQLIHKAQITTIDSFCLYLIKNHFNEIDLDPSFRTASSDEVKLLRDETVKKVIKDAYASGDEAFFELVDCYTSKDNDDNLIAYVNSLYDFAMSYPWPIQWLENHRKDYEYEDGKALTESDFFAKYMEPYKEQLIKATDFAQRAREICEMQDGPAQYLPSILADLTLLSTWKEAALRNDVDKMKSCYETAYNKVRLSGSSKGAEDLRNEVKELRDKWKDFPEEFYNNVLSVSFDTRAEDMRNTGRLVNKLIDLEIEFINAFSAAKRERRIVDFTDMEHLAIDILIKDYKSPDDYVVSDVACGYRDFFEEIMIDEYQDSNLVQEIILRCISREDCDRAGNRFMVGDIKQSIYKFRLARPEIFAEKRERYHSEDSTVITLSENYRSRAAVVDSVNAIFEQIMTPQYGGIKYDESERLNCRAKYAEADKEDNRTELVLIEKGDHNSSMLRDDEMRFIASKIRSMVGVFSVFDKDSQKMRPAEYKDFAVLLRAPGTWTNIAKVFEEEGIPYCIDSKGAFYQTREVRDILNVLNVLNNPLDDISLYGTMVSVWGGFSDSEAAGYRCGADATDVYLYDILRKYSLNNPQDEKLAGFLQKIDSYRDMVAYVPINKLIEMLVSESGYRTYAGALPGGKQRIANIDLLIAKATEYAGSSFYGLFHFLRYVSLITETDTDASEANVFDENADTVRIMSIHKSKGLEFPVCLVAGMDMKFNTKDADASLVCDIDLGIGAKYISAQKRIKRDTLWRKYISDKLRRDLIGEETRVLYVALSRAREKLIMVAGVKNAAEYISQSHEYKPDSYLGMLAPAVIDTKSALFDVYCENIEFTNANHAVSDLSTDVVIQKLKLEMTDEEKALKDRINKNLSFVYPYGNLSKLYTKTTVSELKMEAMEEVSGETKKLFEEHERSEYVPKFMGTEAEVRGTDRGTAYHEVLKNLDFTALPTNMEELDKALTLIVNKGYMPKSDVDLVPKQKLWSFITNPIAERMATAAKAGKLYKEQPFVIGLPASRVQKEFPSDETVLVQGVIDVFFIEDERVVLLDYKTDRVETSAELINRYKAQLEYYGEALTMLTGLKVSEKLLYSFGLNENIVI